MKRSFLLLCAAFIAIAAHAQVPVLVEDISLGIGSSNPGSFTEFNGKLFFQAVDTGLSGSELWSWQGIGTPSQKVAEILPGVQSGMVHLPFESMAVMNGKMYFCGMPVLNHTSLMVYDGVNPPSLVNTSTIIQGSAVHSSMTVIGNKLYFLADTGVQRGLFVYDGLSQPSYLKAFSLSTNNGIPSLIDYKGKLYFGDTLNGKGVELLMLDPATNNISVVADIRPGINSSRPKLFVVGGDKLYFVASDSAHGDELYSYDGANVKRLTDIVTGAASSIRNNPSGNMAYYKGAIYFNGVAAAGQTALYKYDTATQIASLVHNIPNANGVLQRMYATPNNLYFQAATTVSGYELWRYNGTTCTMVSDLNPGTANGAGQPANYFLFQGFLFFNGNNGVTGNELYRVVDVAANTGIQSANWNGAVSLHPNPVTTDVFLEITLQSARQLRVSLTDISGKEVFKTGPQSFTVGTTTVTIPMTTYATGQYFYRISAGDGQLFASGSLIKR